MKQIFILAGGLFFLAACTSPSVIVKNKKDATRPYTKILAVYMPEGCDFALFDSTAYNICLRSCFSSVETFDLRELVESRIQKHLKTKGTNVLRSVDFFDAYSYDYTYFRRTVDSLKVDAVLMVGLRSHSNEEHEKWMMQPTGLTTPTGVPMESSTLVRYKTRNAFFVCDLLNPRSLYMPIWRAEIEERGKSYVGDNGLNRNMTKKLAESLKGAHYIAH